MTDLPADEQNGIAAGKQLPTGAVADFQSSADERHAKVGDTVLLLLRKIRGGVTAPGYNVIDGALGRFTRMSDGGFLREALRESQDSKVHETLGAQAVAAQLG